MTKTILTKPTFDLERLTGHNCVVGIDEAGCGPWAGPVVVACVVFLPEQWDIIQKTLDLNDSKKLSIQKREVLFDLITQCSLYGIGEASVEEIDAHNIVGAVRIATHRALEKLSVVPTYALVDGIRNPKLPIPTQMVVRGDSKSCSIAAASILAKVTRDRLMVGLGKDYLAYAWSRNAGYGTKAHQEALALYGVTPHHRRSYAPIRRLIEGDKS